MTSAHQQTLEIAAGMLAGEMAVLEGCHALHALRGALGIEAHDADFDVFTLISSEVEDLPVGAVRAHWAPHALERREPDVQAATAWAAPMALAACARLLQRFAG